MLVSASVKFYFSVGSLGKYSGAFLNVVTWLTLFVIAMVVYVYVLGISTMVPVFGIFPLLG